MKRRSFLKIISAAVVSVPVSKAIALPENNTPVEPIIKEQDGSPTMYLGVKDKELGSLGDVWFSESDMYHHNGAKWSPVITL